MDVYVSVCTRELASDGEFDVEEMGVACVAVLAGDRVYYFEEGDWSRLADLLTYADVVVGVNDFTRRAVEHVADAFHAEYLGVQEEVSAAAGTRVSLDNVARATLDRPRPDAIQLPLEWRNDRRGKVRRALKHDVLLLRELHRRLEDDGVSYVDPDTMESRWVDVDLRS